MNITPRPFLDLGDITAPKDSLAYAKGIYEEARQSLNDTMGDRQDLRTWVNALREENRYQKLTDQKGNTFLLWEQFCTAPQPFGLGYDPDDIEYIIAERERKSVEARAATTLPARSEEEIKAARAEGGKQGGRGKKKPSLRGNEGLRGNSSDYRTSRIARDHPDILERMKAGEFKSVAAAERAAGIVKDKTPYQELCRWWKKASADEREQFLVWLDGYGETP